MQLMAICIIILVCILPKIPNKMKSFTISILSFLFFLISCFAFAQNQQTEIDSLVRCLRTAGREWNDYANSLINIGEPAVPALIKNAEDKKLNQWNRRISIMTLNQIHSVQWKKTALKILFDNNEDPVIRNHAIAGLKGMNLSDVKMELWELYNLAENESYKSNLAYLFLTADTAMAYKAFFELYQTQNGYIQKIALLNLAQLRPNELNSWYLKGIQLDDWMASNLAMDSLITSGSFKPDDLLSAYNQLEVTEETQWRIIYVFGHRQEAESVPVLVEALQNESWLVHNEAVVGLSRFKPEQVLDQMKAFKKDSRPFVRKNAKWVIDKLKMEF